MLFSMNVARAAAHFGGVDSARLQWML